MKDEYPSKEIELCSFLTNHLFLETFSLAFPASEKAIAIACFLFCTTGPFLLEECNLPFSYSCITFCILLTTDYLFLFRFIHWFFFHFLRFFFDLCFHNISLSNSFSQNIDT